MALQTQQLAELLRPFGQTPLGDAGQRRRVVRHHDHSHLHSRPAMAFVGQARRAAAQEARNQTLDDRAAVATGAGYLHLMGGAPVVQARLAQHLADVLWGRHWGERLDCVRDAHGENSPGMQCLRQLGVVQGQIPGQRVDGWRGASGDLLQGVLHFVNQGQHIAGISGIPYRQLKGEDEARGRLGDNAGFAAKLGGAITLAFADRGNREIVRIDDFTVGQRLALSEAAGLGGDLLVGRESRLELGVQACPLVCGQMRGALYARLRGPCQPYHLVPGRQQLLFRLAHQRHKHLPLAPALPPKAAHNLGEVVVELLCLPLQRRARDGAVLGEVRDNLEDFFFALYNVAASLTRWLPCSLGKVSTTRCAGLTKPASMAAAAWSARSSSIKAASMRLRNWANTSGSTKYPWDRSTWTSRIPHAYITAKSVRSWLQICSSEQCNSCLSNSKANNTRVATDARPRAVGVGKRCAKLRSTATTNAAHGNVSADCRTGWVSGTKSATAMWNPWPVNQCWRWRSRRMVASPYPEVGKG